MITALVIDDEAKGRIALIQKIEAYCPGITVIGEAADGPEGIKQITQLRPGLVFLDIEMPGMNGFEMLNHIAEKKFQVIFTTAYDQYAIKAIKYAALDYLLKPVDVEELKQAVARVAGTDHTVIKEQLDVLQQNIQNPRKLNKLAVPTLSGLLFFDISIIVHLEASSNYTNIYMADKSKITASKTLKEFEDILPPDLFFRPHHSHLINLEYIKRYIKGDGGQIELQNGNFVDVSRRKKDEFLRAIGQ